MTSSKYFYLEYISLAIICLVPQPRRSNRPCSKLSILTATPYHIQSCGSWLLCKVRSSLAILSVYTCLSIRDYQRLRKTTWLCVKLLLIDMHCNSTREGLGLKYVPVPHVIKKNLFHKLIRVIRIFMLKIFVVQCHPQNIFNIELFPNYGILWHSFVNCLEILLW